MTCVLWNAIPRDWADPDGWAEVALEQCLAQPRTLLVLHDLPTGAMRHLGGFIAACAGTAAFRQEFPARVRADPARRGRRLARALRQRLSFGHTIARRPWAITTTPPNPGSSCRRSRAMRISTSSARRRVPVRPKSPYTPFDAPKDVLIDRHMFLGIERGVVVQSAAHGYDHSAAADLLAEHRGAMWAWRSRR